MRYFDEQDRAAASNGLARFGRWLGGRPLECWAFLVVGIILGNTIL